jgi:hypothetical protein
MQSIPTPTPPTVKTILSVAGGPNGIIGDAGVFYTSPSDVMFAQSAYVYDEGAVSYVMPFAGTIKNLTVRTGTTAASGSPTLQVSLRKNNNNHVLDLTVAQTTETTSIDSSSATFAAGDRLTLRITPGSGGFDTTCSLASITMEYDAL